MIENEVALCTYRVVQEALSNALRHSDATHVSIEMTGGPGNLTVMITDDGMGFDPDRASGNGLGLISMRERVESLGGVLEIHSTLGSGTQLRIMMPIQKSSPTVSSGTPSA